MHIIHVGPISPFGRFIPREQMLLLVILKSSEVPLLESITPREHTFHLTAPMVKEDAVPALSKTEKTASRSIREAPRQPVGSARARLQFFRRWSW